MARWKASVLLFLALQCSHQQLKSYNVSAWNLQHPFRSVYRRLRNRQQNNIVSFPSDTNTSTIHDFFMNMALHQAQKAQQENEVPIGAIIVRPLPRDDDNTTRCFQVLSKAYNAVERTHDASAHAELLAMQQASHRIQNWRLLNTTLYSTLEPCPMCLAACQSFRVHEIIYGAPDLRLGAVETHMQLLQIPHPFHNISSIVKNVQKQPSVDLLQGFFRKRRKEKMKAK